MTADKMSVDEMALDENDMLPNRSNGLGPGQDVHGPRPRTGRGVHRAGTDLIKLFRV